MSEPQIEVSGVIEIEIQNETLQTQESMRFAAVPRIGEGIRLRDEDGFWKSYDVVDLWYQKAEFGDIWMPFIHVRVTPGETSADFEAALDLDDEGEMEPFTA